MRAFRRYVAVLVLTALPLLWPPPAAGAINFVSDPAPGAQLSRAPGWVTMAFSFEVDPSTAKVLVLDETGRNVTTGPLVVEWTNITTQLQDELPQGTYTVHYRVSRPDGEPLGGTYQWAYGKGTWGTTGPTEWSGTDAEPEILKNPDPNSTSGSTRAPTDAPGKTTPSAGSSSPSASSTGGPTRTVPVPVPSPGTTGTTGSGEPFPAWLLGGAGLTAAAVAAALVLWWRRNRPS